MVQRSFQKRPDQPGYANPKQGNQLRKTREGQGPFGFPPAATIQ